IAEMANKLGKDSIADKFYKQSLNYKNVFDPSTNLMRGKNEDVSFQSPFNSLKCGDAFTEGNSLHYTWSVFHDVQGLIDLMGGTEPFVKQLDTVFEMPPLFDDSYYGGTIHEIREMQIVNMGNYAHGNQPIQHMLYLYNYAGQPWKGEARLREVMHKLYAATPDGYAGDEDNGQTSAWYVFSALGFYPVTPGVPQYVLGSPLFDKAVLSLPNGKQLTISAANNLADHPYVQQVQLNGSSHNQSWLSHQQLLQGGELKFSMGATPNQQRVSGADAAPYSMSTPTR